MVTAMPTRPRSHVIADQAVNSVVRAIGRAGHAAERVANDYGEDLLVQTSHAGRMDASRLWIQVKGTSTIERCRMASGRFRLDFPLEQVLRWIRTADAVLVILWDVVADEGWFAYPEQVDELESVGQKTVTLQFDPEDRFDEKSLGQIVWQSRISHYNSLCLSARAADEDVEFFGDDDDDGREANEHQSMLPLLALDVLFMIGAVESSAGLHKVTETSRAMFLQFVESEIQSMREGERERTAATFRDEMTEVLYEAGIQTVLKTLSAVGPVGVPVTLLKACTDTYLALVGGFQAIAEAFKDGE